MVGRVAVVGRGTVKPETSRHPVKARCDRHRTRRHDHLTRPGRQVVAQTRPDTHHIGAALAMHRHAERHARHRHVRLIAHADLPRVAGGKPGTVRGPCFAGRVHLRVDAPTQRPYTITAARDGGVVRRRSHDVHPAQRDRATRHAVWVWRRPLGHDPGPVGPRGCEVLPQHVDRRPGRAHLSLVQPDRLIAEAAHRPRVVRHKQDRAPLRLRLRQRREALLPKRRVADRQDLVNDHHIRFDREGYRKPEAHIHARRVVLHRLVDERLQLRERHNLVEASCHVRA